MSVGTSELEEHHQVGASPVQRDGGLLGGGVGEGGHREQRSEMQESRRWRAGHLRRDRSSQSLPKAQAQQQMAETSILTGYFSALSLTQASYSEA